MQTFDTIITHANLATFNPEFGFAFNKHHSTPYGQIENGAIAITKGKIAWLGTMDDLAQHAKDFTANTTINAHGNWITPAFIDCHTHLVYAGNRSNEFEMRLNGVSYETIAKQGGGIVATVTATRNASFDELYAQSEKRLKALIKEGVATVEIKSGYGLDLASERKMLKVARKLGEDYGITVRTTYLAAHATPPEYKGKDDEYVKKVCEWLPILHAEGLVDAVDGFMENIAFNGEQIRQVFEVAKSLGIPVKLHAEQLSDMGGSSLVADYQGLSSDHLEHLSKDSIAKMAQSGTVAVLLPAAYYTLRDTKLPPIQTLREHHVAMALSTDSNPGTSPTTSLLLVMNMGCTLFFMTPEETLAGVTLNAAKALGLQDSKGQLKVGLDADLAMWDIQRPADLSYSLGLNPLTGQMVHGNFIE